MDVTAAFLLQCSAGLSHVGDGEIVSHWGVEGLNPQGQGLDLRGQGLDLRGQGQCQGHRLWGHGLYAYGQTRKRYAVWKDDVQRLTKQPKLIQSRRLTLFGHIMRMDNNAAAKRILLASPPADWRRQLGRPRITWLSTVQQDLKQHHLTLPKQQIWLRTALCEGWCRRMALRNRELHARNDDDDGLTARLYRQ